jgi:hypothetical protein
MVVLYNLRFHTCFICCFSGIFSKFKLMHIFADNLSSHTKVTMLKNITL